MGETIMFHKNEFVYTCDCGQKKLPRNGVACRFKTPFVETVTRPDGSRITCSIAGSMTCLRHHGKKGNTHVVMFGEEPHITTPEMQ